MWVESKKHIDTHSRFVCAEGLPFGIDLVRTNRILKIPWVKSLRLLDAHLPPVCFVLQLCFLRSYESVYVLKRAAAGSSEVWVFSPASSGWSQGRHSRMMWWARWLHHTLQREWYRWYQIPKIEWNFKKVLLHICMLHFIPSIDVMSMMLDSARECTSRGLAQSWEIVGIHL